jgi:hypothetical protein
VGEALTVEAVDNWAAVDNLPVRRAVPPGYVVVLDDDEGLGVEPDELDDAVVASSLDPLLVLDPSVPLFDALGFVSFVPLLCALLSVR